MKVLFVTSYYKPAYVYGGPTRAVSAMCEALALEGADVTVVATNANGHKRLDVPLGRVVDVDGVQVQYFPLQFNGLGYFYSPAMDEALAKLTPSFDLVTIETIWGYQLWPAAQACIRARVPFVVTIHGQFFGWALRSKRLKKALYLRLFAKRFLKRASALHCTDPLEEAAVASLRLGPPTFVVPNPVNVAQFQHLPERGYWRQSLGISAGAVVLLFLGRLTQIKRPDIAIQTLAACRELNSDTHLIMAGPDQDGLVDRLKNMAASLNCAEHVHWTGLLDSMQVRQVLADSDLLVASSEVQENFGMVVAEALAAGVPVLVSEGIPVGRWVTQWNAGRVVPCDVTAFRREAQALVSNPQDLVDMGQRGKELAQSIFDESVVARQMLQQYESIVQSCR